MNNQSVPNQDDQQASQPSSTPILIKKSNKCFTDQCLDRVAKIVGECRYCSHSYCGKHRLPESHACENISSCRQESYSRNSDKLLNGKCVADKL